MPEGHTIHRAARDQRRVLVGHAVRVSSPQGRFAEGAARLDGQLCVGVEAYGKHLVHDFAGGEALHVHLGLYGRIKMARTPAPEPRGAVRVRLLSADHVIDINGPNTCEVLDPAARAALVARIGPDVLRPGDDPGRAWAKISRSRAPIGQLLMDQSVIAGIGNIYRSEILWRQRLHPDTPGRQVPHEIFERLWNDAVHLLAIGVKRGAIVTVDGVATARSRYGERVNIFGKTDCPVCAGTIRTYELATRRVFVCETCQTGDAFAPLPSGNHVA
jgi:endonuclease VIII